MTQLAPFAWPVAFLIASLAIAWKWAPVATKAIDAFQAQRELSLEELRIQQLERETAAKLAASTIDAEIEARNAELVLRTVQMETERQAIEDDPDVIRQFVDAKRASDLKAYEAAAPERARRELPVSIAEQNVAGYREYLTNCHYHRQYPKSYEAWMSRGA